MREKEIDKWQRGNELCGISVSADWPRREEISEIYRVRFHVAPPDWPKIRLDCAFKSIWAHYI